MKTKKGLIGLGLVSLLGYNILTTDLALAQGKYEPIKFGEKKEITYVLDQDGGELSHFSKGDHRERIMWQRYGQNWGKIYINPDGNFELWGVLNDTGFIYQSQFGHLLLDRPGIASLKFINTDQKERYGLDEVTVNLSVKHLGKKNAKRTEVHRYDKDSLENRDSAKKTKELSQEELERRIYSTYMKLLNVESVSAEARRLKIEPNPEEIKRVLEDFLR